jgi:hypothetical protein
MVLVSDGRGLDRSTLESATKSCGYFSRPMEPDGATEVFAVSLILKGVRLHHGLMLANLRSPQLP